MAGNPSTNENGFLVAESVRIFVDRKPLTRADGTYAHMDGQHFYTPLYTPVVGDQKLQKDNKVKSTISLFLKIKGLTSPSQYIKIQCATQFCSTSKNIYKT